MAVEGTIQNGPLMKHNSYSGGDKVARVTANHATGVDGRLLGSWPETGIWEVTSNLVPPKARRKGY
jgi:hypothetical protein